VTVRQKPVVHARDHIFGGADPITSGQYEIKVFPDQAMATIAEIDLPVEAGNNLFVFAIPKDLDQSYLRRAEGFVTTASSSGAITVQIRNNTKAVNLLATPVTIDSGELSSSTAAQAVPITIDPVTELGLCYWGDRIAVNVTAAGTGAWGLGVILEFIR
jgi:hypothetical protein